MLRNRKGEWVSTAPSYSHTVTDEQDDGTYEWIIWNDGNGSNYVKEVITPEGEVVDSLPLLASLSSISDSDIEYPPNESEDDPDVPDEVPYTFDADAESASFKQMNYDGY